MKKISKILIIVMLLVITTGLGTIANALTVQIDTMDYSEKFIVKSESEFRNKVKELDAIRSLWIYVSPGETLDLSMVEAIGNTEKLTFINIYPSKYIEEDETNYEGSDTNVENYEITNIQSLKHLKNLEKISIVNGNNLTDLKPFSGLDSIQSIYIDISTLNSLEGIEGLPNLRGLQLNFVEVSDVSLLSKAKGLEELVLYDMPVDNIDSISSLENLKMLHLGSMDLDDTDIENIRGLINLEYLFLSDLNVENLESLRGLTNLRNLGLEILPVRSIDEITLLKGLKYLDLGVLPIRSIEVVKDMQELESITIRDTRVYNINVLEEISSLSNIKLFEDYIDIENLSESIKSKVDVNNFVLKAEKQKKLYTEVEKIVVKKGQEIPFKDLGLDIVALEEEGLGSIQKTHSEYEEYNKDWVVNEFEQVMETLTISSSDESILRVDNEKKVLIAEKDGEVEITATLFGLDTEAATLTTKIDMEVKVSSTAKPYVSENAGKPTPEVQNNIDTQKEDKGMDWVMLIAFLLLLLCLLMLFILKHKRYTIFLVDRHHGFLVRKVRVKNEKTIQVELSKEEVETGVNITIEKKVVKSLAGCLLMITHKEDIIDNVSINSKDVNGGLLHIEL